MAVKLDDLHKIPIEIIQDFRNTGKSSAIPEKLQAFIREIDSASVIIEKQKIRNITRAAEALRKVYPDISHNTAKNRIYDAITMLHIGSTVSAEAWNNYYADRLEDLHDLNIASDNPREARLCLIAAKDMREAAAKQRIDPSLFKPRIQVINVDITANRLGLSEVSLKQLWTDTEDFIGKLPIDKRDKEALLNEAAMNLGVTEDAEYEFED